MTNHTNCLHPATPAGRAACRKAGGPSDFHCTLAQKALTSAPCSDCFWNATESAAMNLTDDPAEGPFTWGLDATADSIRRAKEMIAARSYLYDIGALSACSAHEHLI